jgi:osmoprotectant transport system substrate-binding protein
MKDRRWGAVLAVLALALAMFVAACGDDDDDGDSGGDQAGAIVRNADNASTTITVGSKNFTEQQVLGSIYAQALAAAGYKVKTELNLGDEKTALKALEENQISGYPEYTGTALASFFGVKANEIPKDPDEAFDQTKSNFEERDIVANAPTPFTSSNEVALTKQKADELGVENISDLEDKAGDLTLYGSPECRQRTDCLLGLQQVYGLKFKKFTPVAIDLRHEVLKKGQADVSIVFTTDPQIQRDNFVLLKDDKGMFPPYNSTFVARKDVVDKAGPDLAKVVEQVNKGLTAPVMQELNARVEIDKETPEQAATQYLKESGLVG